MMKRLVLATPNEAHMWDLTGELRAFNNTKADKRVPRNGVREGRQRAGGVR